jgi:hypothetical protein
MGVAGRLGGEPLLLAAISPNFSSVGLASIRRSSVEKCEINYLEPAQNSGGASPDDNDLEIVFAAGNHEGPPRKRGAREFIGYLSSGHAQGRSSAAGPMGEAVENSAPWLPI